MAESKTQTIRQLKMNLIQYKMENTQYKKMHEKDQKKIKQVSRQADTERKMWPTSQDDNRRTTENAVFFHRREVLEDIIGGKLLRATTSVDRAQFDCISDRFIRQARKHPELPLFSEDGDEVPGNRCKLPYRYAILLSLMRKTGAPTQEQLAAFFGIDQSTVCRYLRFANTIFAEILPTASKVEKRIRNARTIEEIKRIVPNLIVMVDGTHMDIRRPSNKDSRKEAYSGKKKSFTRNVQMMTANDGLLIHKSASAPGSTHDISMIKDNLPDLGLLSARMRSNKRHTRGQMVKLLTDLGYLGIKKVYPGVILKQPHKKPKGGKLTRKQRAQNKRISGRRIIVEHATGHIRQYRLMCIPYDGTAGEFDRELDVITGLVNFKILWDRRRKKPGLGF